MTDEITEDQIIDQDTETDDAPLPSPLEGRLQALRASNRAQFEAIRALGSGLDPTSVLLLRLDTLISLLLRNEDRVRYELAFETNMSSALADVLTQARQAKLTEDISVEGQPIGGSGLVDPAGRPL